MVNQSKNLLVSSTEAYSGKSAMVLGLIHQLQTKGLSVFYGKPIGTCWGKDGCEEVEEDIRFIAQELKLNEKQVRSPILNLTSRTINQRLQGEDKTDYSQFLRQYVEGAEADIAILEGPGTLWEGNLFELSAEQMAQIINASILLVARYSTLLLVDNLLAAQRSLGDRLLGVLINDIPPEEIESTRNLLVPFLERQGIEVLGLWPRNNLLRSVSVREIALQLEAKVLCRPDRLDFMVENLCIGAMNVNSAIEYFRQGKNLAIVTGSDRSDLQLAALETSASCLILTGRRPPSPLILGRAEDLEVPVLSVHLDTLSTVEIVDRAFGRARLQEPIKVRCIQQLMQEHFNIDSLLTKLGLEPAISA